MRPAGIAQHRRSVPTAKSMVEALAADQPVAEIVAPFRRHLINRKHAVIDRPSNAHLGVDPRLRPAGKIWVKPEPARHRLARTVVTAKADRESPSLGRKLLRAPT